MSATKLTEKQIANALLVLDAIIARSVRQAAALASGRAITLETAFDFKVDADWLLMSQQDCSKLGDWQRDFDARFKTGS